MADSRLFPSRRWLCRGRWVDLTRTLVMGIVNATPDSFFPGSRTPDAKAALDRAKTLLAEGADILDIGGESTRPGAAAVSEDEEIARICPVVSALTRETDALISVDTRRTRVAAAALEAGAHIINDVQGVAPDEGMWRLIAESGAGYVLMHSRGTPETMDRLTDYSGDVVGAVRETLETALEALLALGCRPEQVMFDPGLGFAKTHADSLRLLGSVAQIGRRAPVLIGASRKRFIGEITGEREPEKRLAGSLGTALRAAEDGAAVVRVHDVRATRDALCVFENPLFEGRREC